MTKNQQSNVSQFKYYPCEKIQLLDDLFLFFSFLREYRDFLE